ATASISSPECAALYGLKSLSSNIQDKDSNFTKFILIASKPAIYPGSDRISLSFTCPNKAGALSHILNVLASRGINVIKLESCPIPGRDFEFMFYVELDCGVCDPGVISALEELERYCEKFEFIGSYIEI
ncbi:MAG: ACT domain-containing protein, partial [Oscillospiraceae bacterium]|nr:ACT domain-containing protein [Oscillospiraceae bacterium]